MSNFNLNTGMTKINLWKILLLLTNVVRSDQKMEGFIVGGSFGDIAKFPHAVCLNAYCDDSSDSQFWVCGSTVLNQRVLLTAAHCVDECETHHKVVARAGASNPQKAQQVRLISRIKMHEEYDKQTLFYDIALVLVNRALRLMDTTKRASIKRNFPSTAVAMIAGWGVVDERHTPTVRLKFVKQTVWRPRECLKYSGLMPGTFCASTGSKRDYPFAGDSGSGLVIEPTGEAQVIGLVSYRVDDKPELTYYTNVSYFRAWIRRESGKLYCNEVI